MDPYATSDDVAARWRPLTSAEEPVVNALLEDASDIIRVRWPDMDSRILSGAISASTLVRIVSAMVKRAMLNRDFEGVTQGSETVGPFSQSQTFANPTGNLYLSADEIRALDGFGFHPRVKQAWLA